MINVKFNTKEEDLVSAGNMRPCNLYQYIGENWQNLSKNGFVLMTSFGGSEYCLINLNNLGYYDAVQKVDVKEKDRKLFKPIFKDVNIQINIEEKNNEDE